MFSAARGQSWWRRKGCGVRPGAGKCQVSQGRGASRRVRLLVEERWKPLEGSTEGLYLFPASLRIEVKQEWK